MFKALRNMHMIFTPIYRDILKLLVVSESPRLCDLVLKIVLVERVGCPPERLNRVILKRLLTRSV